MLAIALAAPHFLGRAADGQRREDGGLEELAAGRLAFDGVLEPCAGQMAISCKLV